MQISIIPADKTIVKNGEALVFDFVVWPTNLRAMQWNGVNGTMEFTIGANQWFDNSAFVEGYITAYDNEAEAQRLAAITAAEKAAADQAALDAAAAAAV